MRDAALLQDLVDLAERRLRLRRVDEQVDLLATEVIPVPLNGLTENTTQVTLESFDKRLVFQRAAPELDHELIYDGQMDALLLMDLARGGDVMERAVIVARVKPKAAPGWPMPVRPMCSPTSAAPTPGEYPRPTRPRTPPSPAPDRTAPRASRPRSQARGAHGPATTTTR